MKHPMHCDNCKYYHWYNEYCAKWQCEVDCREAHNCFEPCEELVSEMMVKGKPEVT